MSQSAPTRHPESATRQDSASAAQSDPQAAAAPAQSPGSQQPPNAGSGSPPAAAQTGPHGHHGGPYNKQRTYSNKDFSNRRNSYSKMRHNNPGQGPNQGHAPNAQGYVPNGQYVSAGTGNNGQFRGHSGPHRHHNANTHHFGESQTSGHVRNNSGAHPGNMAFIPQSATARTGHRGPLSALNMSPPPQFAGPGAVPPQFTMQFAQQFPPPGGLPHAGTFQGSYAGPFPTFQPANAAPFVPKTQGARVIMKDANGQEISDLRAHLQHARTQSHGAKPETASPAAAVSVDVSTDAAPAAASDVHVSEASSVPPAEPMAEFKKPTAPISEAAQKMREMIALKRQMKAAQEAKSDLPEAKLEAKETKETKEESEVQSEPKLDLKTEIKPELKSEPKIESKIDSKIETKTESNIEPKIEPKIETKSEIKPEPKSEPKSEPQPASQDESKPEIEESKPAPTKGKFIPPHLRAGAQKTVAAVKSAAETAPSGPKASEPKAAKPEPAAAKDTKTETKAEPVSESAAAPAAPSKSEPEPESAGKPAEASKPESKTTPEQTFLSSLEKARTLTPQEMATIKYPPEVSSRPAIDGEKFRYPLGFLMQFANVVPRPYYKYVKQVTGFEGFDSGVDRWPSGMTGGRGGSSRGPSRSSSSVNFSNRMSARGGPPGRDASMRGGRNNSRRGKGGDRQGSRRDRDEPQINVADLPPLRTAENAWKPSFMKKDDEKKAKGEGEEEEEDDDHLSPEEVQRKVKSLLNKLAWENFDKIAPQIREIALQSRKETNAITVRQIVQLIFEKATDEAHWSQVYAGLFFYMHRGEGILPDDIVDSTDPEKPVRGLSVLRRYLLSMAQMEFEKGWADAKDIVNHEVMSDEYYQAVSLKRRGLGLIQFIGELYKAGLITVKLVAQCVIRLGQSEPSEDVVESMARLIKTIAPTLIRAGEELSRTIGQVQKDLDDAKVKLANARAAKNTEAIKEAQNVAQRLDKSLTEMQQPNTDPRSLLEKAMQIMTGWRVGGKLPARLRFQIMDMEDLAKKNWVGIENNGPKTIAEVHMEAELKAQEAEREKMKSRQASRRGNDFGRSMSGRRK